MSEIEDLQATLKPRTASWADHTREFDSFMMENNRVRKVEAPKPTVPEPPKPLQGSGPTIQQIMQQQESQAQLRHEQARRARLQWYNDTAPYFTVDPYDDPRR